ncbi:MAG: M48 family metalloprotease [Staphylothermus sp.]|nr:M48 family metalloprotease [Staphylothermus sp.]
MTIVFVAYIVGMVGITFLASKLAPRIAASISNKMNLYSAMLASALTIIIGSLASIYVLYYLLSSVGIGISLVGLLFFIIMINLLTWLMSPWLINLMYGATPNEELQQIVNDVSRRAGIKPPKAMVVQGPPNAFAYGNILTGKYVAVTTGMLDIVDKNELEAVIGHELGHHKHKDNAIMLLFGIFPSVIYYLGIMLIRTGIFSGVARLSDRRESGGGGIFLVIVGAVAILLSLVIQILVLAFSRLREYYADAHGSYVSGARNMQKALAKLHLYYEYNDEMKHHITNSKLRTLFIYAFTEAVANPFYSTVPYRRRRIIVEDIDHLIESLKQQPVDPAKEVFMSHPPIPKRLRFLDQVETGIERIH